MLLGQAQRAIQRQPHPQRRRGAAWIHRHKRNIKRVMPRWPRQPLRHPAQIHRQCQLGLFQMHTPDDTQPTHLQQPRERRWRPSRPSLDGHPVIRHQHEAALQQLQREIGLATAGRTQQKHPGPLPCHAARMYLHGVRTWGFAAHKKRGNFVAMIDHISLSHHDVTVAAGRIAGYVRHTPLIALGADDLGLGYSIKLKLELLQHAGSFKPRGAFNRILAEPSPPKAGVIAASGGNHGAAVAFAARRLGLRAEIFVPELASAAKRALLESLGATLIVGGATYAEALAACQARQAETGALDIHAYDHPAVLAGQGTTALEFQQDAPELTHVLVAVGGGGLIGGMAAWYHGTTQLVAVEPEGCPCLHDALQAGHPVPSAVGGLAADALGARQAGALMFPLAKTFVGQSVLVSDSAIAQAQTLLWQRLRLIAEPGGATALAALLSGAFTPPAGAKVGVLVCGGNTDPTTF